MTKYDKEREEEYERQRKEDERMMREAEQGANAAQAQKNASEIGALASVASSAAQATAQQMSGGVGEKPQYETEQEKKQNQAAVENAVAGAMSDTRVPGEGSSMTKEEYNRIQGAEPNNEQQQQPENSSMTKEEMERIAAGMQQNNESGAPVETKAEGAGEGGGGGVGEAVADSDLIKAAKDANKQREQTFMDIVNDYKAQKDEEERQMRIQEQANMMSSMATGTTELAAGIINMLSVGELGATHQQYNNPTADWMKKSEADIKANRERRRNMADTLDRLKMQQAELKAANRLEEAKLQHSLKKEQEEREWRDREWQSKQEQIKWQQEKTEKQMEMQERAQERADKQADAAIAQRWAQLSESRKANVAAMLANGYVPDKKSPSGYRYDPKEASKWALVASTNKGSGKDKKPITINLLASGNLPAETLEIESDDVLKNTILANIDAVTDLMDIQKQEIRELMEDNSIDADKKANLLKRYLVNSDQLRSLFRTGEARKTSGFTGGQMAASDFLDVLNQ